MTIEQGYLVITRVDGSHAAIPMSLVFAIIVIVSIGLLVAILVSAIENAERARYANYVSQLPAEIAAPQPLDYYQQQTAQLRAIKEKLDADAALAESYIKAMQVNGVIEELPEIIAHEQTKRDARGQ